MQQTKKTKRSHTVNDTATRFLHTMHSGINYFSQLNIPQFKIRKNKKIKGFHNHSAIQDTQIYELLQENKKRLIRINTEVNDLRELQFNQYIKKSIRYQELLDINDNKKKHLSTMNAKVGQVVKKAVQQAFPKNILYNAHIYSLKVQGWKPEARQGHSLTIYKDQAVLIGGHCSSPFGAINIFSFAQNRWVKTIPCEWARSYHSTILYKNRFAVIFGGMGIYNKSRKTRDCHNTIFLIDLLNNGTRNLKMHNEDSVQPRRCHTATLLGRYMLVIGGINSKKQYLNDFIYLDLKELRWYHKEYRVQGKELQQNFKTGFGKHASVSTFRPRKSYSFYSSDYQQNQAIFCFGGYFGNQQPNIVMQLVLNKFVPTFKKVDYSGSPPSPISPITEFYYQNSIIIISGESTQRQIRLFKIKQKSFTIVTQYSMLPLGGVGSSLSQYSGQYYLFYGLGEQGYSGEVYKFSLHEQIKQSQNKRKKLLERNNLRETNYLSETSSMLSRAL